MSPLISAVQAWGPLVGVLAIMAGLVTVWVKGIPARMLAKSAGDATLRGEEKGLREYLNQQLASCRNDNAKITEKMTVVENKNFQLTVVISMMLSELLTIDPDSPLVKRAKAVLELNIGFAVNPATIEAAVTRLMSVAVEDPKKSSILEAAEDAVEAAEQTVIRAEKTVIEVKGDNGGNGK
jgi:hypothetical protein